MPSARDIVIERVAQRARRFPDFDIAPLDTVELDPRDAALALAIDHIVARRWLTLSAVIGSKSTQPWEKLEPKVQAPLLVGAAQLLFMERVPDHAVVNDSVAWTKRRHRPKAGGLVNAVLRRVAALRGRIIDRPPAPMQRNILPLEDGRAWWLEEDVFAEDVFARLAGQTSHPEEVLRRWMKTFGKAAMTELALHNLVHAPIIVAGIRAEDQLDLVPHEEAGFSVYKGEREGLDSLLSGDTRSRVQDPATAHAIASLASDADSPQTIIDLCAGRGTKTKQLAEIWPEARIIATDIDEDRAAVLRATFRGAAASKVEVVEFGEIRRFDEQADLLVIDAPCSNSGVLARRVEAKYRLSQAYLEKVAALQRQILADSIPLLHPSGKMLYITCSIEPVENEDHVAWLAKWHGMRRVRESRLMPRGLPGDPPTRYIDGGYAALLSR